MSSGISVSVDKSFTLGINSSAVIIRKSIDFIWVPE